MTAVHRHGGYVGDGSASTRLPTDDMLGAMSVKAQRRRLIAARLALTACAALFAAWYVVPVLQRLGIPPLLGVVVGLAVQLLLWMPLISVSAARYMGDYALVRRVRPVSVATSLAASVVATCLVEAESGAPTVFSSTAWLVVQATIAWPAGYWFARTTRDGSLYRKMGTNDPVLAAELAQRSRAVLEEEMLDDEQRAVVALNLAGALIVLSARADQDDVLSEAIPILDEIIASSPPVLAFEAADKMAEAMRVKADLTGDEVGYDRALATLLETAENAAAEAPHAVGAAHGARAMRLERLAAREPGPVEAERLQSAALANLERALEAVPEALDAHAVLRALFAHRAAVHPLNGDLDESVRLCRGAVRRLRHGNPSGRARAMLLLADILEMRAVLAPRGRTTGWPRRSGNDLMRATWLCMQLAMGGEFADEARMRLPRLRAQIAQEVSIPALRRVDRHLTWGYGRVFREQASISGSDAAEVAAEWAAWAMRTGDEQQAAEAAWCWVTAVTADLRRRVLDDKEHRIGQFQGAVAETASLLVGARRLRDAAVALDVGRAVLLTERMHRERDGLEERLLEAGHTELAERWRRAGELVQRTDRAGFEDVSGPATLQTARASDEYLALNQHGRLLREIEALPGFEDVESTPDYDDLRAAAGEGPVVYLAATEARGFALVVTQDPDPVLVELPAADRATIERLADQLATAGSPRAIARRLEDLLPVLWADVVGRLVDHLPRRAVVTLIAGGTMAELPLHVAGTLRDDDGVWRDRTGGMVFRYAPNARVLLRGQRTARAFVGEDLSVLTAAVPDAPGRTRLRHALAESAGVAATFPPGRAQRPVPATVARVERSLDECAVWHLACHGIHDRISPLDSTLELADRPLTLRSIFARPSAHRRLAVLSACHSATPGAELPDEVVGFPSAMLQAGVAGVVACHADVDDYAAMLLVLDFFARFHQTGDPARALADAQAWLRAATNAELRAAFPGVHELPEEGWDAHDEWSRYQPFRAPSSWALFSYTGA